MNLHRWGGCFLLVQSAGAAVWWGLLLAWPPARGPFLARGAPDATLLAFAAADAVLFIGAGAAAGYGLLAGRQWAWPVLCTHAGAAGYAGLYCWALPLLTGGDGWLGAVLMTPSLVGPAALAWAVRPARGKEC